MFNDSMEYSDMDRILREKEITENLSVIEILEKGYLSKVDIELFLSAYCKEFNINKKDLNDINKVGNDIFQLSAKLQSLRSEEVF